MKVGLKYCGGCNSRYDRVRFANWVRDTHPEWEVVHVEDGGAYDLLLVVCGCPAACASVTKYSAPEILRYSSENLPEEYPARPAS